MHAVFNFSCGSGRIPHAGAGAPKPTDGQQVSDLSIYGNYFANYSIFAPGIVHSRFRRLFLGTSTNAGLSLGYGWINSVVDCRFSGNGIGLHTYASANGVEVLDSIFEAGIGPAMYITGTQHLVQGNVIEGNGGPAVLAMGLDGLVISGNYFEGNCNPAYTTHRKDLYPDGLFRMRPDCWGRDCAATNVSGPIVAAADIVLNGASSWHEGSSDYKHWPKLEWRCG
jgi:hypothetical protein